MGFFLNTLKEAFFWINSKVESFIEFLQKKFNAAADNARRFFDNFSEKFKQAFTESKQKLDAALKEVVEIMCWIKRSICSNVLTAREKISLSVNMVSSLIGLMKQLLNKHIKKFIAPMKEMEIKTNKRFKSDTIGFNYEDFYKYIKLILGFSEFLQIVHQPPKVQVAILLEALINYLKKDIKGKEDEVNKAAMFVYFLLKESETFLKSLLASLF